MLISLLNSVHLKDLTLVKLSMLLALLMMTLMILSLMTRRATLTPPLAADLPSGIGSAMMEIVTMITHGLRPGS